MCNNDHYYGGFIDSEARRVIITIISITNTNSLSYYSYFETTDSAVI